VQGLSVNGRQHVVRSKPSGTLVIRTGYTDWSMTHAFFAVMEGFILHAPDFVPFPVNVKQVHYLVTQGHIPYSAVCIDIMLIQDKNKNDGLGRSLAALQALWFFLNFSGRFIQELAITILELKTVQFILASFVTFFFLVSETHECTKGDHCYSEYDDSSNTCTCW
jgi:hypothetical protein